MADKDKPTIPLKIKNFPDNTPFTLEEIEELMNESLRQEYREMRKRVKEDGIKSLSKGEREFFLNYEKESVLNRLRIKRSDTKE